MANSAWRKRLSIVLNRLYLYPAPQSMPATRAFWIASGLVGLLVLAFSIFFIMFLIGHQNAYLTHAEDLGIMDQAIWSIWHGPFYHQTICNPISDTNCYSLAGIPRFAIHFEPIMFPISLLYLVFPTPKTLLVLQTLVVASGAFPAFWLTRLRLRNEWAGVVIAALYLLYPAQQWATIFDFHAVTLTAALLLFVLYFMYTRRTVLLFVFAILAMACKEEIPVVLAIYALWSIVFQRRYRSGLALFLLGIVWTAVGLYVVHVSSPLGHSLLTSRLSYLGNSPVHVALHILRHPISIIKQHVFEHAHFLYLRGLFAPTAYLALLAPWIWVLAVPTLGLNLLSADPSMYSGLYQYDAEMVPVFIFATIEALVLLLWLVQEVFARYHVWKEHTIHRVDGIVPVHVGQRGRMAHSVLLIVLLVGILFSVTRADYYRGTMPFSQGFSWPVVTAHDALAQRFINMIPPNASVSAQSNLVPHISHRAYIYQFPYADKTAEYVFLDVTSDIVPFFNSTNYINEVKSLLVNGRYGIVAAQDGYLLLKRGLPAPGLSSATPVKPGHSVSDVAVLPKLPPSFCSYIDATPQEVTHPMDVAFSNPGTGATTMDLVGFNMHAPLPFSRSGDSLSVTTYWRVVAPMSMPLQVVAFMAGSNGKEYLGTTDFPATYWCQTQTLQPGMLIRLTSRLFNVQARHLPTGVAHLSLALAPLLQSSRTIMSAKSWLPLHIVKAPATVTLTHGANGVEVNSFQVVP